MSGLEVSFLVGAGVSLAGVVAVLIWLPSRASPVPRDPPGERVIVPDYPVPTDDDHRSLVTLERRDAKDARVMSRCTVRAGPCKATPAAPT